MMISTPVLPNSLKAAQYSISFRKKLTRIDLVAPHSFHSLPATYYYVTIL